jgi:hypothetical protein
MIKRKQLQSDERHGAVTRHPIAQFILAVGVVIFLAGVVQAIPVSEYHRHIRQAVTALDSLAQADENESATTYSARDIETVRRVRNLVPAAESVEFRGEAFTADNSWLQQELDKYSADNTKARYDLLQRITERLKAIDDRLEEVEKAASATGGNKADNSRKLAEILSRPEYAHKVKNESALGRLLARFLEWLKSWMPKPKPISPGSAGILSRIAQWFVIILALGVLAFVLKLFLPRMFRGGRPKRKKKETARIVLGERLEPEQSGRDLLSEAEALARRGELRAAIRKAYIALLVELGERKIISLAQHKTNRDYLRAMRELEPLYRNMKQLTDSFERHWYGLSQADEAEWLRFRAVYDQALAR